MKAKVNRKARKVKVEVGPRVYLMTEKELEEFLQICSDLVPFGIYAVRKGDYVAARNDKVKSVGQLKRTIRKYKELGFKSYYNEQTVET